MTPRPPICMSMMMTTFPKALQCSMLFTTTSPVTHTALVAVNNASTKPILRLTPEASVCEAIGKSNSIAPTNINKRNPSTRICVGFKSI